MLIFMFFVFFCFLLTVQSDEALGTHNIYIDTLLKGLRPMPPTRDLNASRLSDRLQVTSGGPRNQPRNQAIVQAHSVWTIGVLGDVLEGSWGIPWGCPFVLGILGGFPLVPEGCLGGPWWVPGKPLGEVHGGSQVDIEKR